MTDYTPTEGDWLRYIHAQGNSTLEWVADWIAGSDLDDCEHLCDALDSVRILVAAAPIDGDPGRYSDDRAVYVNVD